MVLICGIFLLLSRFLFAAAFFLHCGKNKRHNGLRHFFHPPSGSRYLKCRNNLIDTNACMRMHACMNIIDYQNRSIKIYIKQQKLSGFLNPFSRHRAANRPISSQLVAQAANAAKLRQQHSHHIQMGFWNTDIFMAHLVNKRPHILFSIILIPWACQPGQRVCEVDYIIPNHSG